ncbi:MAG: mandelate racemase/muconate lactonizing enzyme family protein [Zavarzinella sp.]|nr:mandelate racemase/muconate lactonizing enzyme family protein [Zavarzinella sp.]
MHRREFLKTAAAVSASALVGRPATAALPKAKVTKVTIYEPPDLNPLFNQSNMVVTIETDTGLVGVGEGGSKDTLEQCAGRLIGQDPFRTERLWQDMYRAFFYPPGREKVHALGALDLALWDLKGKALDVPVYDLLGGMARDHFECYLTGRAPAGTSLRDRAKAVIDAGFRAFRMDAASVRDTTVYNARERVRQVYEDCKEVRAGVGKTGDWLIDFHTRFDLADAMRACKLIEEFEPFFVEDAVRSEAFLDDLPKLRKMTIVPLAAGEQWGSRWDFHKLVEAHDIDFVRATLPNVGGITEMQKVAALCETHSVGICPHFTGPIATAALVHVLGPFSGPVLMEFNLGGKKLPHLPEWADFKDGKVWPNKRPGLGVTLDKKPLKLVAEVTKPGPPRTTYTRPDGSMTNW